MKDDSIRSTEEIVDKMDQLFGLEAIQKISWKDLRTLKKITIIDDEHLTDPKYQFLKRQYERELRLEPNARRVVSVLNAMFTQNRAVIVIDRDNIRQICKLDLNWKAPLGLPNDEYRSFLKMLYSHTAIECVVDGKKGGGPAIIKLTTDSSKIFGFDAAEVERQTKETLEFVAKGLEDKSADMNADIEGSSQKKVESGKKEQNFSLQKNFQEKQPKEENLEQINNYLGDDQVMEPVTVWSNAIFDIAPKLLQKSGFTNATIVAFDDLIKDDQLPLVSKNEFELILDEKLLKKKFEESAKNINFRFDSKYCQEIRAEILFRFDMWHKNKIELLENSPEAIIEKYPFPSVFAQLCELADHFSAVGRVAEHLIGGFRILCPEHESVIEMSAKNISSDLDLLKLIVSGYTALGNTKNKLIFRREFFGPILNEFEEKYRAEICQKFGPIDPEISLAELCIGKRIWDWWDIAKDRNDPSEYIEYVQNRAPIRQILTHWPFNLTEEERKLRELLGYDLPTQSS